MQRTINMMHKSNLLKSDLLIIAVIFITGLKFTFGIENVLDIGLYDESNYLYRGVKLASLGLPKADWAPLYSIWYFILSLFEPNRIRLYYLNFKLMTILPPIFLYAVLRRTKLSTSVSFIIAWLLLLSQVNIVTWPKVSHFALIIILSIFLLVSQAESLLLSSLFISIGALLVSYIRPEYFFTFILSLLFFIIVFIFGYRNQKGIRLTTLTVYTTISILLLGTFGLPISGDRSIVAFGQHFSLNWVSWTGSDLNPWTNWTMIISRNFGSSKSIWDAFTNNPVIFVKHVTCNILGLVKNSSTLVFPVFFPTDWFSKGIAVVSLIGLYVAYIPNIRKNFLANVNNLIFIGLYILPELLAIVIIYPRNHYLLLLYVLITVAMAFTKQPTNEEKANKPQATQTSYMRLLLLGSLIIALTPYFAGQNKIERPNLDTIYFIQSLKIESPVNLLEAEGGFNIYLSDNFNRVAEYDKSVAFDDFLRAKNINMIVTTGTLLNDSRFKDDTSWRDFLKDSATFGFTQMAIPFTNRKLFVRNEFLPR